MQGTAAKPWRKLKITQFPTALKKLKNPKMQDGMSQWYESLRKANSH